MSKLKTYDELRKLDVSGHIEKKNGLSYLSWAWAVDVLLQNDPDAKWEFPEPTTYPDGTMMVYCVVTAFGKERKMHLPVLDYKNAPIKNPNAFQINTSLMRCLVKAIGLHGIGLYIYAGEDLPETEKETTFTDDDKKFQRDFLYGLSKCFKVDHVESYLEAWSDDLQEKPDHITGHLKDAANNRIAALKNGVKFPPAKYGFINVKEAVDFTILAKSKLDNASEGEVFEWFEENEDKITALDEMLTAAKYTQGGKPSEKIKAAYNKRIHPQAAE